MNGCGYRRWIAILAATIVLAGLLLGVGARTTPAQAAPDDVVLLGHGFGHGRGLSQWGSFGHATQFGWNHLQILGRYYSNTGTSDIGNPPISVRLTALDGAPLTLTSNAAFTVDGRQLAAGTAADVSRNGDGTWQLTTRSGCGGAVTGSVRIAATTFSTVAAPGDDLSRMLTLCAPERRTYRGALSLVWDGSALRTVNTLPMEDYLRGVVPRESPASWADTANGIQALMAQAVAARSYARTENRATYAQTCDTTTCQVYGGAGLAGARLEDVRTDRAVLDTAGDVRTLGGQVARTEFSSSSGGYTAGGTFPAVPDDGDVVSPHHDWNATLARATIATAFGVGTLQAVTVLTRNGLGADGGRVLTVRVTGASASVVVTGTEFRTALGLRSDWFSVRPGYDPTRDDLSPVAVGTARTNLGTLLTFVRGSDGAVWVTTARNSVFGPFQRIPSAVLRGPAAVSDDGRRVHVFVVGSDRAMWHASTVVDGQGEPTGFSAWQSLGGTLTTAPAVASSAPGRLVVAARGGDGAVYARTFDGSSWSAWQSAGGQAISAPAVDVVSGSAYRLLVVGTDGTVWSRQISALGGAPTTGWSAVGEFSAVAPGASGTASWARAIRALAYAGSSGVRQVWADGRILYLGGVVTSGLSLVEWGSTSVWTLVRGGDNALWLNVVSGSSSAWYRIGGALA